jgi:hypothetical protein
MKTALAGVLAAVGFVGGSVAAAEPQILGEYVEARTCDVWTGPCFANGEINLRGDNAILVWVVRKGSWDGVELKDLSIVAVLDAEGTLTTNAEGKVKTVVYVDDRATDEQGKALISMAVALSPKYLKDIVKVEKKKIAYSREDQRVDLKVGDLAEVKIKTATFSGHCDSVCGNESSFYPSLAKLAHVECAKTIDNAYSGSALGLTWSDPNKRSAMLGTFSL